MVTFGEEPRPRSNEALNALRSIETQGQEFLKGLDGFRDLDELILIGDWHGSGERTALRALLSRIGFGIEHLAKEVDALGTNRGGRNTDSRIQQAVSGLAVIYQSTTGSRPTHTQDPETGDAISAFNQLVKAFFSEFYPETEIPWTAVRNAMAAACRVKLG